MNQMVGELEFQRQRSTGAPLPDATGDGAGLEIEVWRSRTLSDACEGVVDNGDTGVCCAMIGYLLNGERLAHRYHLRVPGDVQLVGALYAAAGIGGLSELDGMFSVFLLDRNRHRAYLLQDPLASDLPLYYAVSAKSLLFGTSLKQLLSRWPHARRPNLEACYDFLRAGSTFFANLVPNGNTLVQHIHKVPPNAYLEVDTSLGAIRKHWLTRPVSPPSSQHQAKRQLMGAIDASIDTLHAKLGSGRLSMSMSGGFDSNYIIHRLRKLSDAPFRAFTVGGQKVNEIPQASAIAQVYDNVDHITSTVNETLIESFPDIVWRLEGYVYESGVFLQYALAELVARNGVDLLFLGDGADQFLDSVFYSGLSQVVQRQPLWHLAAMAYLTRDKKRTATELLRGYSIARHARRRASDICRYFGMLDFVIKKVGLMLNSVGVQGVYPFLSQAVREVGPALGPQAFRKRLYKQHVQKALDPRVNLLLKKGGGRTDIEFMFRDRIEEIARAVTRSPLVRRLLRPGHLDTLGRRPDLHWHLLTQLLYLDLFDHLLLSGDHDQRLGQQSNPTTLSSYLEQRARGGTGLQAWVVGAR